MSVDTHYSSCSKYNHHHHHPHHHHPHSLHHRSSTSPYAERYSRHVPHGLTISTAKSNTLKHSSTGSNAVTAVTAYGYKNEQGSSRGFTELYEDDQAFCTKYALPSPTTLPSPTSGRSGHGMPNGGTVYGRSGFTTSRKQSPLYTAGMTLATPRRSVDSERYIMSPISASPRIDSTMLCSSSSQLMFDISLPTPQSPFASSISSSGAAGDTHLRRDSNVLRMTNQPVDDTNYFNGGIPEYGRTSSTSGSASTSTSTIKLLGEGDSDRIDGSLRGGEINEASRTFELEDEDAGRREEGEENENRIGIGLESEGRVEAGVREKGIRVGPMSVDIDEQLCAAVRAVTTTTPTQVNGGNGVVGECTRENLVNGGNGRKGKKKCSDRESMINLARADLESGAYKSLGTAAAAYGISKSTLAYRVRGGLNCRSAHEKQQRLTHIQEHFIVEWIIQQHRSGSPPTYAKIRNLVETMLRVTGRMEPLGKIWIKNFLRRNPRVMKYISRKMVSGTPTPTTPSQTPPVFSWTEC